jgi:uncharacterized membrane protein YidH (DUF202 family)
VTDVDDRGLQHERTELGWRRTGLAAAALTVGFVRVHINELDATAVASVAFAGAIVLVILAVVVRAPSRRDGRIPAALTALVAAIAVAQLAAILAG